MLILLNGLVPVVVLIALGVLLRRIGFTSESFHSTSDKLVYFIFFPLMLFWKIGGASLGQGMPWNLCFAVLTSLSVMFLISLVAIKLFHVGDYQAGSFAQSCYRFNTYIGVAIVLGVIGEEGVAYFGMVISLAIPIINVVAVSTLIWFSSEETTRARKIELGLKALISNPLILGCLAGIVYSNIFSGFPEVIDNCLRLMSMLTLPLALLSIGASLTFAGLRKYLLLSLVSSTIKLGFFPIIGYACLRLFGVSGDFFVVGMIFFCLPTSTAIYVLSAQLQSDTTLASAVILSSTLLSFPLLGWILYLLA